MDFQIGDYVTRKSYDNDIIFRITDINDNTCELIGFSVRLIADSDISDLVKCDITNEEKEEDAFIERVKDQKLDDRGDYFYLPGKILHIDGDTEYLDKCMRYYKSINLMAMGINLQEDQIPFQISKLLEEYNPSILVITGHDAYYKKRGGINDLSAYKNSGNFVKAVNEARKYEKSHEKLIIIAGACQSDYEELIKAGANFASSPKRINIHALDPAIIATSMSLADINQDIDLKEIINKTKYGKEGIGGIITKGTMYRGYPR